MGEEAIVDLTRDFWQGRSFAWVRQQSNFCRREGVIVDECPWRALSDERWESVQRELADVSAESLSSNPQRGEINLLEGHFSPARMARRRLFMARADNGRGRIEGFLVCHPCLDGARWVFETYRHRPDARRGVCAALMHTAMRTLEGEGVESVSLCLVPGLRCHRPMPGDSPLVRWGIVLGTKYFNVIHDTAGMYHFKTRFRPRFENRYLCVRPRVTLSWALHTVRSLGVLQLNPRVLAADVMTRLRKRGARKTLKPLAQ